MDDLDVLGRDFGFGSRGKSNPMRSNSNSDRRSTNDDDPLFNNVFAAPNPTYKHSSMSHFDYDSIFNSENTNSHSKSTGGGGVSNNKPVYDEDIFDGLPGVVKNKSPKSNVRFDDDDVFVAVSSPRLSSKREQKSGFDDHFLGNNNKRTSFKTGKGFDDLLPGFGTGNRAKPESNHDSVPQAGPMHGNVLDDSFSAPNSAPGSSSSGVFTDPLDEISKLGKSRSARSDVAFENGATFDDLDSHAGYGKPSNPFSPSKSTAPQPGTKQKSNSSLRYSESSTQKQVPVNNSEEPPIFDMPNVPTDFGKSFAQTVPPHYYETGSHIDTPTSEEHEQQQEDIWLTISEVPLFTPPTASPPPSRPPPPIPRQSSNAGSGSYYPSSRKTGDGTFSSSIYSEHSQSPKLARPAAKGPPVSQYDELDDFAMGNNAFSAAAASADAMKDAMDKAEAKFRHAKEVREREHAKAKLERGEQDEERLERERKQKADEEREKGRQAVGRATREARERAAIDARDRAAAETRLRSDRAAVDKANAEARARAERAAVQRAQVERAAVQRAQAEARERAASDAKERAEKAAAEARERTAAEARERTAAEAKEKALRDKAAVARAEAEARRRAERAAVDRAAAEARQRAAAQARERAEAAATKTSQQQKNDDDLENFFNMGRESSAPRSRENSNDSFFNQQSQNKGGPEAVKKASPAAGPSYNIKKSHSSTNVVDDLASIFGAPKGPSSGGFQEVDGETDERRRARLAVHQRTQQRAAQALAEKNNRDLQAQREQEERHRISDTLDIEIKRWAAGKEGNLRAMLSTLQYVLWPECGWQPVSLTDLITGASVRKVYRKATLCIHPDKVQQKGATLQQKYIAEKVFDLLKEAWNKLNSEELF